MRAAPRSPASAPRRALRKGGGLPALEVAAVGLEEGLPVPLGGVQGHPAPQDHHPGVKGLHQAGEADAHVPGGLEDEALRLGVPCLEEAEELPRVHGALEGVGGVPLQGAARGQGLEAALQSAAAGGPPGEEGQVAELPALPSLPPEHPSPQDHPAPDPRGDGEVEGALLSLGRPQVVLKVARPTLEEVGLMRKNAVLMAFLHLAVAESPLVEAMAQKGLTAIGYELVGEEGRRPVLKAMSEIAGRMAPQLAGRLLEAPQGPGILLSGLVGIPPADVVVLGAGVLGKGNPALPLLVGALGFLVLLPFALGPLHPRRLEALRQEEAE